MLDPSIKAHIGGDGLAIDDATKQLAVALRGTIPAPDPNRPVLNAPMQVSGPRAAEPRQGAQRQSLAQLANAAAASMAASRRSKLLATGATGPRREEAGATAGVESSAKGSQPSQGQTVQVSAMAEKISLQAQKKRERGVVAKKMEADFGKGVAMAFKELDPRKDMVRNAESRFQFVVEEERTAKRMRRLHELEVQDAAEERLEAMITVTVQAWRCHTCHITTEMQQSKIMCEQQGHRVESVQAKRGRWECRGCAWSVQVLDGEVPAHCHRCNDSSWKQVPLHRPKRALMDKDLFLARGEELPFLNSLPPSLVDGRPLPKRIKESEDAYAELYKEHA